MGPSFEVVTVRVTRVVVVVRGEEGRGGRVLQHAWEESYYRWEGHIIICGRGIM